MSTDIEITDTGVTIPDTEDIYDEVITEWDVILDNKMQKEISTPQGQMATSLVAEIDNKNVGLQTIINQINPKTNSGVWQDAIGYIFYLTRLVDASSVVTCQCIGSSGTIIPAGSTIRSTNGDLFTSNDEATIGASGTVDVNFSSVETGLIPVNANTLTTIVDTISGWDSVDNSSAGTLGRDLETRAEFETRRQLSIARNSRGTVSSIYSKVSEITGVLDLYVRQNRTTSNIVVDGITITPSSVYCCVLGGETKDVCEAIESVLSAGCDTIGSTTYSVSIPYNNVTEDINIQRPTAEAIKFEVNIANTASLPDDYQTTIKDLIYNNFYGLNEENQRVKIGETLYSSRFYGEVADIEDLNVISIELGLLSGSLGDSVYIEIDKYASLDKTNITINLV